MKKVLFSLLALVFMATVICCDESGNPVENVALKNFANSGCKGNTRAGDEGSVDGNIITITESETEQGCKCLCPYDLSYEVGPLTEGETYTIFIKRRDAEPIMEKLEFKNSISGVWK